MKLCIHVRPRDDGQGWAVDVFDGRRAWAKTHLGESPLSKAEAHRLVRYWPICPPIDGVPPVDTTTRSEAWTLGDGSVVVLVDGKSGGVHLSHIEVLP